MIGIYNLKIFGNQWNQWRHPNISCLKLDTFKVLRSFWAITGTFLFFLLFFFLFWSSQCHIIYNFVCDSIDIMRYFYWWYSVFWIIFTHIFRSFLGIKKSISHLNFFIFISKFTIKIGKWICLLNLSAKPKVIKISLKCQFNRCAGWTQALFNDYELEPLCQILPI